MEISGRGGCGLKDLIDARTRQNKERFDMSDLMWRVSRRGVAMSVLCSFCVLDDNLERHCYGPGVKAQNAMKRRATVLCKSPQQHQSALVCKHSSRLRAFLDYANNGGQDFSCGRIDHAITEFCDRALRLFRQPAHLFIYSSGEARIAEQHLKLLLQQNDCFVTSTISHRSHSFSVCPNQAILFHWLFITHDKYLRVGFQTDKRYFDERNAY